MAIVDKNCLGNFLKEYNDIFSSDDNIKAKKLGEIVLKLIDFFKELNKNQQDGNTPLANKFVTAIGAKVGGVLLGNDPQKIGEFLLNKLKTSKDPILTTINNLIPKIGQGLLKSTKVNEEKFSDFMFMVEKYGFYFVWKKFKNILKKLLKFSGDSDALNNFNHHWNRLKQLSNDPEYQNHLEVIQDAVQKSKDIFVTIKEILMTGDDVGI
jgi:hypothetical protein